MRHHLAMLLSAAALHAQIDQQYVTSRMNGLEITGSQSAAQTFTCGKSGLLLRVDVDVRHWVAGVIVPLDVRILATDTAGVPTNQVLASEQLLPGDIPVSAYAYVPVRLSTPVAVQPGLVLALELAVPTTTVRAYAWSGDAPGGYANGTTFIRRNVGPLSFDMGFRTWVGIPALQVGYGAGHPGTNGVPSLALSAAPRIGTTPDLVIGNSSNAATQGALCFGVARASLPTPIGGTLLVQLLGTATVPVGLPNTKLPLAIPDEAALCGGVVMLQVLMLDAAASHGVSFTPGLELLLNP